MAVLHTGLIGQHISRTRLPTALQIMCDQAGLSLKFEAIDTAQLQHFDLPEMLARLRREGWTSVSVTHPFKSAARIWVGTGMDAQTEHLLSCNTVVFGPKVAGYNTDYTGFAGAWRTGFGDMSPGSVVMAGAGGVAQAIGPALKALGASSIGIADTQAGRGAVLAEAIGDGSAALATRELDAALRVANGLVNATPLGMAEHPGSAFASADISSETLRWAFDAVYTPVWTPFLKQAADAGLRCLTGFDLFKAMAIGTFEACSGRPLPRTDILPLLDASHPDGMRAR